MNLLTLLTEGLVLSIITTLALVWVASAAPKTATEDPDIIIGAAKLMLIRLGVVCAFALIGLIPCSWFLFGGRIM